MKKSIAISFITVFLACNNPQNGQKSTSTSIDPLPSSESCYTYNDGKDSIKMHLKTVDNQAMGNLDFNYYEKDANTGTFSGTLSTDTLWAIYTFASEGTESQREVVFLKQGDNWVQGYGDIIEKDSIFVFKNHQDIRFDNDFPLEKTGCNHTL